MNNPEASPTVDRRVGLIPLAFLRQDGRRPVLHLTVEVAAAALGIGRTKTCELIAAGELETVHIGRCCRVPVEAVEAYVSVLRAAP